MKFNSIKDAINDIKNGKVIIVIDDENRENEGDFLVAAELATPEIINFMATHGRGLICAPLTKERCLELELDLMIGKNTAAYETPFTISVDLLGNGCSTGISASDRSKTVKALASKSASQLVQLSINNQNIKVLGPVEAPIALLRGQFRFRILIKGNNRKNINKLTKKIVRDAKLPASVKLIIDVDPYSFM